MNKPRIMRSIWLQVNMWVVMLFLLPSFVIAQGDGPRFYWKGLMGMNAIPVISSSMGGNANPLDPSYRVDPNADFEATLAMPGYARFFPLFNRAAMASVIVPMGRINSTVTGNGTNNLTARGYGDPMLQLGVNIIGPRAIKNIPEILRYKPGFSVDVIGSLAIPIGEYDNESPLNIGQNRWYGRLGMPVVWQISPSWAPGKRTTFEALPAIWIFGKNNDFVGKTIETKPLIQIEGHITRDFMERLWGSLNMVWYVGAQATIDGEQGTELNNIGIGGTLGYTINNNMQFTMSYMPTVNDTSPDDLKMDAFRVTLIYGWHKLIEGMHRLQGE